MRAHRWLAMIPALLVLARVGEIVTNIETASGFYKQPRTVYHLLLLGVVLLGCFALARLLRGRAPLASDKLSPGGAGFILCACAGAVTAYACFMKLLEIIRLHPFYHFFMNREQLAMLGFKDGWFRLEFFLAVLGFAAAGWYIAAAVSIFRDGALNTNRYFALVPVLWYCIRAAARYICAPINANDSVSVYSMASLLVLGWAWYALARYFNFLEKPDSLRRAACWSFAALCFTVGFAAPNLAVAVVRGAYADALLLAADALAALCAGVLADRMILSSEEKNDVQQQVD